MARVEKSIEVDVPVHTAYNQWTQFEDFPHFMEGVQEVRQVDDKHLHWKAKVGGKAEEWDAVIREQVPDQRIIWQNTSGPENAGVVRFDRLGDTRTRVHLEMSYDPEGFVENVGDALGFVGRRVDGDLQRFKDFIEQRQQATGAWRGTIENPDAPGGHTMGKPAGGPGEKSAGRAMGASSASAAPSGPLTGEHGSSLEGGAASGMPGDRQAGGGASGYAGGSSMASTSDTHPGANQAGSMSTGTSSPSAGTSSAGGGPYTTPGRMASEYPETPSGVEGGVGMEGGDTPGNSRRDIIGRNALNDDEETSAGDTGR